MATEDTKLIKSFVFSARNSGRVLRPGQHAEILWRHRMCWRDDPPPHVAQSHNFPLPIKPQVVFTHEKSWEHIPARDKLADVECTAANNLHGHRLFQHDHTSWQCSMIVGALVIYPFRLFPKKNAPSRQGKSSEITYLALIKESSSRKTEISIRLSERGSGGSDTGSVDIKLLRADRLLHQQGETTV